MLLVLNENISLELNNPLIDTLPLGLSATNEFIYIEDNKFKILQPSELVRKRNDDGYFRVIYIQINFETGEYYIGKSNRPTWKQLLRYQGSGLKFRFKFNKHKEEFVRYFIAACSSAKETETREAQIITKRLLADPLCLNLVSGGGGQSRVQVSEDRRKAQSVAMKENPSRYQAMLKKAREIFSAENQSRKLTERNKKIKATMQNEKYREMSRQRMIIWKSEHPEEYKQARIQNRQALDKPESKQKRVASLKKWKEQNPEAFAIWEQNRRSACQSEESKEKRRESLKKFKVENPQKYAEIVKKRAMAAKRKRAKKVEMLDLITNKVINKFDSLSDAGKWLFEQGKTKSLRSGPTIGSVCSKKATPGHGVRKSAFGYGWRFSEI